MRIFKKAILILLIANALRIIPGCCECNEPSMEFDFNRTEIRNLDNSGIYPGSMESDTMFPGAVAFEVNIFDSTGYFYNQYSAVNLIKSVGFKTSQAFQCDCSIPFNARQYLTDIRITTFYSISESIPAGSNVTELFLGKLRRNFANSNSVYHDLSVIIRQTENKTYYDSGIESFGIYLKPDVENQLAQFEIQLTFSDQRILTDTTQLIHIKH